MYFVRVSSSKSVMISTFTRIMHNFRDIWLFGYVSSDMGVSNWDLQQQICNFTGFSAFLTVLSLRIQRIRLHILRIHFRMDATISRMYDNLFLFYNIYL